MERQTRESYMLTDTHLGVCEIVYILLKLMVDGVSIFPLHIGITWGPIPHVEPITSQIIGCISHKEIP